MEVTTFLTPGRRSQPIGDGSQGAFPSGWFQVGWSDELAPGAVQPLRYFGRDLVLFRTEAGSAVVMDAHCPHLGAHLGHGGAIEGNTIRCPFHGWVFDQCGSNVDIPFASRPNAAQQIRVWPTSEENGWILVWHHPMGEPPTWSVPILPEHASNRHCTSPALRQRDPGRRLRPQMIPENIVDGMHQVYVHGGTHPLVVDSFAPDGPIFRSFTHLQLGVGKGATWLTDEPTVAEIDMEAWGLGLSIGRHLQDEAVHVQAATPVDERTADLFATLYVLADPDRPGEVPERGHRRFSFEMKQLGHDIEIWEHMEYVPKPPFAPYEARPFRAFRKWASQFYDAPVRLDSLSRAIDPGP